MYLDHLWVCVMFREQFFLLLFLLLWYITMHFELYIIYILMCEVKIYTCIHFIINFII